MLSRKSAVISKLSVTRDSLMRSPLLLPVCLPLHSPLSLLLSFYLSPSPVSTRLMDVFLLSRPFLACVFARQQARDSVWSRHVEKKASRVAKKASSLQLRRVSVALQPRFFISVLRPITDTEYNERDNEVSNKNRIEQLASQDQDQSQFI